MQASAKAFEFTRLQEAAEATVGTGAQLLKMSPRKDDEKKVVLTFPQSLGGAKYL